MLLEGCDGTWKRGGRERGSREKGKEREKREGRKKGKRNEEGERGEELRNEKRKLESTHLFLLLQSLFVLLKCTAHEDAQHTKDEDEFEFTVWYFVDTNRLYTTNNNNATISV